MAHGPEEEPADENGEQEQEYQWNDFAHDHRWFVARLVPVLVLKEVIMIGPAIVAGIIGGIIIDAFLAIMGHTSPVNIWQFVASTVVGQAAYSSPSYAVLGFCVHFIVSIVWAIIYAYVFRAIGQLRNWILGAIVWGIVVDAAMSLLLTLKMGSPWWPTFRGGLLAHVVFYALPVALYLAYQKRPAAALK